MGKPLEGHRGDLGTAMSRTITRSGQAERPDADYLGHEHLPPC